MKACWNPCCEHNTSLTFNASLKPSHWSWWGCEWLCCVVCMRSGRAFDSTRFRPMLDPEAYSRCTDTENKKVNAIPVYVLFLSPMEDYKSLFCDHQFVAVHSFSIHGKYMHRKYVGHYSNAGENCPRHFQTGWVHSQHSRHIYAHLFVHAVCVCGCLALYAVASCVIPLHLILFYRNECSCAGCGSYGYLCRS